MIEDALHLHQVHFPDRPDRAVTAIANFAAATRARLTGDPEVTKAAAVELFDRAVRIGSGPGALSVPDRVMLHANGVNALADWAALRPGERDGVVLEAIDAVEQALPTLAGGHSARIRASVNLGGILVGLHHRSPEGTSGELLDRAHRWLAEAYEQSRSLPPGDAVREDAASTLAALHFRLGTAADIERAGQLLTESVAALAGTESTRLHHTVAANLAQLHLSQGDEDAAVSVLEEARRHADAVIGRAASPATRLAHVASAGDLHQRLALLHARREDARAVMHTVERSRARWRADQLGPYDPDEVDRVVAARLGVGAALLYVGSCGLGSYAVLLVAGHGAGV